jgi:hypothetical protein
VRRSYRYRTNIAALWLFTAATIVLLVLEYRHYIDLRFKWLTLARTHNYSVMVRTVPVLGGHVDQLRWCPPLMGGAKDG